MKKELILLITIILIGFLMRIWQIGVNPPAMHADEADTGYTALSLLKTGMDPYGNSWPLHFQGQANIYRSPIYTYSVIPFVHFMGLSAESTRLPSVIFGTLLIIVVYLILNIIFKNKSVSLIGAFLVAINPWSIHLSRTGLEVQLSVLLTSVGVLFFLMKDKIRWTFYLSSLFFGLSLFSYHAAKIFSPLIIILLILFNLKDLKREKLKHIVYLAIFGVFCFVIAYLALAFKGAAELSNVSIFESNKASETVNTQRTLTNAPLPVSSIFSNKPIYYFREFINHYSGILSVNYLFINGENNLDKGIGNYGQFHPFELLPFILGLIFLWKRSKKYFLLIIGWFSIAIVPAGITKTGYYAYRDVNAIIPIIIISSIGFYEGYKILVRKKWNLVKYVYALFTFSMFAFFLYNYYFAYPVYSRDWWANGQKNVLKFIAEKNNENRNVFIHGGSDWNILYAFYNKIDPLEFQRSYKYPQLVENSEVVKIDHIYIGNLIKDGAKTLPSYMKDKSLVVVPGDYFEDLVPVKSFYGVDGIHVDIKILEAK